MRSHAQEPTTCAPEVSRGEQNRRGRGSRPVPVRPLGGDVDGDGRLDPVAATQDGYENPDAGSTANQLRRYAGNGKGASAKFRLLHQNWYDLNGGF
ncbi:hypothetical protein [Streptomyces sp. NPDC002573]|uniref:hypothetical protein n=1 Tax=Streptomyces sp. NPDC002573 TaxID=3364651 RepID=UPI0036C20376